MASLRKRGKVWYFAFVEADGVRREHRGCSDRRETERLAAAAEAEAAKVRAGFVDARDLGLRDHAARPIGEHLDAFLAHLEAKGSSPKHVALTIQQARRLLALAGVERLADLSAEGVQAALKTLRDGAPAEADPAKREKGLSLGSCNSYRTAVRGFSKWCLDSGRTRDHALRGLAGFNAREDRRHDRRTLSLEELRRLIETAHNGPSWRKMSGEARALCYRLAASTGLRYSEIQSIKPESFDWRAEPPTVRVEAGYTKNGQTAECPLPTDLASDLRPFAEAIPPGAAVFPLTDDRGATMLKSDLARAKIPYRDNGGLVADFHSLRASYATALDRAGVSPRVVQRLMRHSTLELTGRYTKPRAVDLDSAATSLPSLRPRSETETTPLEATGTDGGEPISKDFAAHLPREGRGKARDDSDSRAITVSDDDPPIKRLEASNTGVCGPARRDAEGNENAPRRTRTFNPLIKSQLLCQLS